MHKKFVFRVDAEILENMNDKLGRQQVGPFLGEIVRGLEIQSDAESKKEKALDQLEKDNGVKRRGAFERALLHPRRPTFDGSVCLR
jgi:hypothetical protein